MRTYPSSLYNTPEELEYKFKTFCYMFFNVLFTGIFASVMLHFTIAIRKFGIVPGGAPLVMILGAFVIIVLLSVWYTKGLSKQSFLLLILLNIMFITEVNHVNMWNNFASRPTITHAQAKRLYTKAGNLNLFARISDEQMIAKYPTKILTTEKDVDKLLNLKEPAVIAFFKVGCPYCERAHNVIINEAKRAGVEDKLVFVNYESDAGHTLEHKFNVDKVTTLITIDSNGKWHSTSQSIYKDGVRQLTPDTNGIKSAFNLLK